MDPSNWKTSQVVCMVLSTVSSEGHTVTDSISRLIVHHIAVVKADCYVESPLQRNTDGCLVGSIETYQLQRTCLWLLDTTSIKTILNLLCSVFSFEYVVSVVPWTAPYLIVVIRHTYLPLSLPLTLSVLS